MSIKGLFYTEMTVLYVTRILISVVVVLNSGRQDLRSNARAFSLTSFET